MIYFITDTHCDNRNNFYDKKHIKYLKQELNKLNHNDTLIHLGDIEDGNPTIQWHKIEHILKEHNVKIIQLIGNHDSPIDLPNGLWHYKLENENIICSHMPFRVREEVIYDFLHLAIIGHLHPKYPVYSKLLHTLALPANTLYSLDEIKYIMKTGTYRAAIVRSGVWDWDENDDI